MAKDRYAECREGLQVELNEIKAKLAARPTTVQLDMDGLVDMADCLDGAPPDDREWREIVAEMMERVVIGSRGIEVVLA